MASDLSPGMVERGRARAAAEGYDIEWLEADAEELPFEDERFDCVGSVFDDRAAAGARGRRAVPGGQTRRYGGDDAAWRATSLVPKVGELARKYGPPVAAGPLPRSGRRRRAGALRRARARIDFEVRSLRSEAGSPEEYLEQLASTAPPLVAAKQAMAPEPYEAMKAEILEYVRSASVTGRSCSTTTTR